MNHRILLLTIFVLILGCTEENEGDTGTQPAVRATEADYIVARLDTFRNEVITTAEVLPYESVTLRAPLAGTVLEIYFDEGARIQEGELMIRLDDRAWKAQLKGLEVEYNSVQKELERYKRLMEIDGASQQQIDNAVARLATMQATMDQLKVSIQLANIRAPFSGQVGLRNFSKGSYLSQGEEITTLAEVDRLKVNFNLPERYRPDVQVGETIRLKVAEDTFPATIYAIDPIINVDSRTVQARAVLERGTKSVMPGVFAETILPTEVLENAIVLPSQVVVPEIEAQTVYVAKNGKAQRRVVTISGRTSDMVLITEGVQAGDTVITTGLMSIKEGAPLSLQQNLTKR